MSDKTKCPFCGGTETGIWWSNARAVRTECRNCGALGPLASSEEIATRRWETRNDEDPQP